MEDGARVGYKIWKIGSREVREVRGGKKRERGRWEQRVGKPGRYREGKGCGRERRRKKGGQRNQEGIGKVRGVRERQDGRLGEEKPERYREGKGCEREDGR